MRTTIRTQILCFYAFYATLYRTVIYTKSTNNSAFPGLRKSLFDHAEKPVRYDGKDSFMARNSLFRSAEQSLASLFPTLTHRRKKLHGDTVTRISCANTHIFHINIHLSHNITMFRVIYGMLSAAKRRQYGRLGQTYKPPCRLSDSNFQRIFSETSFLHNYAETGSLSSLNRSSDFRSYLVLLSAGLHSALS